MKDLLMRGWLSNPLGSKFDIVALGDSVTYGAGVARRLAYPARLARALDLKVYNAGLNGDTAPSGLARLERDALSHHPDIVLIGFGLNDSGLYAPGVPQTPPARFREALTRMAQRVRGRSATPVLLAPNPVDAERARTNGAQTKSWGKYDRIVRQVAMAEETPLVDLKAAFGDDLSLLADGIHPTAEGYARIAVAVEATLEEVEPASRHRSPS